MVGSNARRGAAKARTRVVRDLLTVFCARARRTEYEFESESESESETAAQRAYYFDVRLCARSHTEACLTMRALAAEARDAEYEMSVVPRVRWDSCGFVAWLLCGVVPKGFARVS